MVKCLPEFEYLYCFLEKEKNISKIRRPKVTDYAALKDFGGKIEVCHFGVTYFRPVRIRCTISRSHSNPCKKAEFEPLQFFSGHCFDFLLPVSGKICHSLIKKVEKTTYLY